MRTHRINRVRIPYTYSEIGVFAVGVLAFAAFVYGFWTSGGAR